MARQTINLGSSPNRGDGDPLRLAFTKINSNFEELYQATTNAGGSYTGDVIGSVFADDSTLIVDGVSGRFYGDLVGSVFANDSSVIVDGTTGTIPGYVSVSTIQDVVSQSVDFADFKSRIANL